MTSRRIVAILLAGASLGAIAPAQAAKILFSTATDASGQPLAPGAVPPGQGLKTSGGTVQVMLDSGAIVSFVGPASFAIGGDGTVTVASGSATIVSFGVPTQLSLPGAVSASVTGAGSFNLTPNGVNGMALSGAIALSSGGQTRDFGPGQSYNAVIGAAPNLIFAASAQAVPGTGTTTGDAAPVPPGAPPQNPAIPALTPGTPAQVAAALRAALTDGAGVDGGFATALLRFTGPTGTGPTGTVSTGTGSTGTGSTGTGSTGSGSTGSGSTTSSTRSVALAGRNAAGQGVGGDPGVVTVGFDANGNPNDFALYGKPLTATVAEAKFGDGWTIGRYSNGTFQRGTGSGATTHAFSATEGVSYAVLAPLSGSLPTGLATYSVTSFTQPVLSSGAAISNATFAATLGVAFGSAPRIGYNGTLGFTSTNGAENYSFTTPGGAAAPSVTGQYYVGNATNVQIYGRAPLTGTGSVCNGSSCRLDLTGIFGGAGANLFGAYYSVFDGTQTALTGAAVFTLSGNDPNSTIGNPAATGSGTLGSGTNLTTANQSGLANANLPSSYVGANVNSRVVVSPAVMSVQFDADGNPTTIGGFQRNGAKLLQLASGSGWTIGSFGDGNISSGGLAYSYGPYQGVGFAVVAPTTALPTSGRALYTVSQTTIPTLADGSLAPGGTFTARLGIAFGVAASSIAYGYDGRITIPEPSGLVGYSFSTNGGADAPSLVNGTLSGGNFLIDGRAATSTTGANCATVGACLVYLRGSTGGANATVFGATYELYNVGAAAEVANGAAIFAKTSGTGAGATGATGTGGGSGATTPTYILSYAANPQGIDTRPGVTATFDGNNGLQSYYASYQEFLNAGTNAVTVGYQDSIVSVGRWAGGTTQGTYYANSTGFAYPANGGFAYAMGSQSPNLPASGTLQYNLLGFAAPTFGDGRTAPGTVTSAALGVTFGATSKVGLEFAISMPGDGAYGFSTTGGAADPSQSSISITKPNAYTAVTRFNGGGTATGIGGQACPDSASCSVTLQGWFAGERVERAGLVYTLGGGSTFAGATIHGALAFGSAGLDVPALPTAPTPENTGSIGAAFASSGNVALMVVKDGQLKLAKLTANLNVGFDSANALEYYQATGVNQVGRGTAVTGEAYGTANVQIGRWNGGTTTGAATNTLNAGFQGHHYALINVAPTISQTTGVAQFALAGATKPTYGDGFTTEGSFSGSIAIALDTAKHIGFDLAVAMPDRTYVVQTAGGTTQPSKSAIALTNAGQLGNLSIAIPGSSGHACPDANCVFTAQGGLAGSAGGEFAMAYTIGSSTTTFNNYVDGAAAFTSTGFKSPVTIDARSTPTTDSFANGNYYIVSNTSQAIRANNPQTFGSQHELTGGAGETIGSNSAFEVGARSFAATGGAATAFMGWGRWSGGKTGGTGIDETDGRGLHYVYGTPTTVFPTSGTVSYALVGGTAPTVADGTHQAGTLASGAMTIAFGGTNRVGLDLAFSIPNDASYTINTLGGAANPATSGLTISGGQAAFTGTAIATATPVGATSVGCGAGACGAAGINGILFGAQAAGVGIVYTLGTGANQIAGAAAFAR